MDTLSKSQYLFNSLADNMIETLNHFKDGVSKSKSLLELNIVHYVCIKFLGEDLEQISLPLFNFPDNVKKELDDRLDKTINNDEYYFKLSDTAKDIADIMGDEALPYEEPSN